MFDVVQNQDKWQTRLDQKGKFKHLIEIKRKKQCLTGGESEERKRERERESSDERKESNEREKSSERDGAQMNEGSQAQDRAESDEKNS